MNQLHAIQNVIQYFAPINRRAFIVEFLEDINFHSESRRFAEGFCPADTKKLEFMESMRIAANEKLFAKLHFEQLRDCFDNSHVAALDELRATGKYYDSSISISSDTFHTYCAIPSKVSALNTIFGWGLDAEITAETLEIMLSNLAQKDRELSNAYNTID